MVGSVASGVRPWLLIEASREGVIRFATMSPSARPRIAAIHEVEIAGVPTFTDVLQRFEREKGVPLSGLRCAMAIAGAASGETISLVRSRWTISRAGLQAVFGTQPVILNDVAARAWATRSGTANIELLRGIGTPNFSRPGRYGMVMIEEGLGAAIVDVDRDAGVRVLETEAGHMDFAPTNDREERLAKAVRGTAATVTWEMVLMLDRFDPVWGQALPDLLEPERPRLQATLLGRFAINLMHTFGAWQGMMITGTRAGRMLEAGNRVYFDSSFATRRNFSRLIIGAPAWRVDQHEAVLTGVAERLATELEPGLSAAA
jgi:glucokinase